ncbi:MAG: DMT family transporter [Opitutales bacterium]|nr:DMT family transporter [Opitutales bacterium]
MLPALLTTILFSFSAIAANRSVSQLGSSTANVSRLLLAAFTLGIVAIITGVFPGWWVFWIFFLSGVVGFGFGDIGVFYALPRLGSRLCILYTQCVAAPIAGIIEWLWMGTSLSSLQILWAAMTLVGVAIALDPRHAQNFKKELWLSGTLFGLLAAFGQGAGAVISRYGYDVATATHETVPPMTAAGFRVFGGVLVATIAFLIVEKKERASLTQTRKRKFVILFIILNALAGPILGVSCYQWALAVQPSFVVLPIVALSPIVVIPMSMLWEGDRPSISSILGALIAVGSAIMLTLATI